MAHAFIESSQLNLVCRWSHYLGAEHGREHSIAISCSILQYAVYFVRDVLLVVTRVLPNSSASTSEHVGAATLRCERWLCFRKQLGSLFRVRHANVTNEVRHVLKHICFGFASRLLLSMGATNDRQAISQSASLRRTFIAVSLDLAASISSAFIIAQRTTEPLSNLMDYIPNISYCHLFSKR